MKTALLLFLSLNLYFTVTAQNVGIGTTTPVEKLHIKNPLRSTVKISSNSFNDTTELLLSNRDNINQGTDFSFKSMREEGLFLSSLSDLSANTSANSIVVRPNGNVGIGILPTSKLDINGGVKLEGLNLFEFGAGVAGKEVNAGKIGYNAFGQSAMTFVGGGTNPTNRAFYFYGEGGSTFSGPMTITGNTNIGGQLQLNGNPGTPGQVLTSNGATDPVWTESAFGNNTRFAVTFSTTTSTGAFSYPLTTQYNLNATDVSIGANSFTINKTGLYHFDCFIHYTSSSTTQPLFYVWLFGVYPSLIYFLRDEVVPAFSFSGNNYRGNWHFSLDVHITAPATISLRSNTLNLSTTSVVEGDLIGHLINQ